MSNTQLFQSLSASQAKIVTLKQLDQHSLERLISGEILAIRIPDYCSETVALALNRYIEQTAQLHQYTHEIYENGQVVQNFYGVHRWGTPFNSPIPS